MMRLRSFLARGLLALLAVAGLLGVTLAQETVSGKLENGLRVISVSELSASPWIRVFRGDYIQFDKAQGLRFSVPAMDIDIRLPDRDPPYFKMQQTGVYDYLLGATQGTITVVEYTGSHYQAVNPDQASDLIKRLNPLILDVRTPKEYEAGHLENARLMPVQTLAQHLPDLSGHKDDPVLLYCATGNRSTVAAKILIDNGFTKVFNLTLGIKAWQGRNFPVVR